VHHYGGLPIDVDGEPALQRLQLPLRLRRLAKGRALRRTVLVHCSVRSLHPLLQRRDLRRGVCHLTPSIKSRHRMAVTLDDAEQYSAHATGTTHLHLRGIVVPPEHHSAQPMC
jgi:hypothetical protein